MEVNSDAIVKVQAVVWNAMDTLSRGDYHSALLKFDEAKETCRRLKPFFSGPNVDTLVDLEQRCQNQSVQIQQYIESSDDIYLGPDSQFDSSTANSSIYRESEIGDESMVFSSINKLDGKPVNLGESNIETYWSGYLWDKVEALLGLIQPHTQNLLQRFQTPNTDIPWNQREEVTLDSSFILMPQEIGSRSVHLSDPIKKTVEPADRIKELEARIVLLMNQMEQMKKVVQPQGVTNLMNENTKLKKSIIDFSNHVQKHNSLMKSHLSRGDSIISGSSKEMELQIHELLLKVAFLEKENLKKDKEIKELAEYKEKWQNLKKEAIIRKKQKESEIDMSNSNFEK